MNDRPPRLAIALSLLVALVLQLFEIHPYWLAMLRPLWVPLVLVYWVMVIPQPTGLLTAWVVGLLLDVLLGSVLGQHALSLTLVVFLTLQMRGILALYSVWQEALFLTPVWLVYIFVNFWIDGVTGHRADPFLQWMPLATTSFFWPFVYGVLGGLRRRRQHDPSTL